MQYQSLENSGVKTPTSRSNGTSSHQQPGDVNQISDLLNCTCCNSMLFMLVIFFVCTLKDFLKQHTAYLVVLNLFFTVYLQHRPCEHSSKYNYNNTDFFKTTQNTWKTKQQQQKKSNNTNNQNNWV